MKQEQAKKVPTTKLYIAAKRHEVVFISSEKDTRFVKDEAEGYLEEQDKYFDPPVVVQEITCKKEIPEDWQGDVFIWGVDETTANQFLETQAKVQRKAEYEEYLRLKAKFE